MTDLSEQFKRACYSGYENDSQSDHFISGARYEYARLLPFLNVAADVIEAADRFNKINESVKQNPHMVGEEYNLCEEELDNALNRLREALEK